MRAFFIGLQFLTRISVVHQENWTMEDFGRSVKFFPLVGAVLGGIYALAAALLVIWLPQMGCQVPHHLAMAVLLLLPVCLTGGLHTDGFMDTMDGILSGRSRERMLEIMKDSRTGSMGVTAFVLLLLLEWAILLDMDAQVLVPALFVMPILGRVAMVLAITSYPYARKEGMGKAFAAYAGPRTRSIAMVLALVCLPAGGWLSIAACMVVELFVMLFAHYVVRCLGGLTGDVYGAVTVLSEVLVLLVFLLGSPWV